MRRDRPPCYQENMRSLVASSQTKGVLSLPGRGKKTRNEPPGGRKNPVRAGKRAAPAVDGRGRGRWDERDGRPDGRFKAEPRRTPARSNRSLLGIGGSPPSSRPPEMGMKPPGGIPR